jgi:flagellar basal body-associated protein FliL
MEVNVQFASPSMRQRIVNIFAGKTNEKLVPVQEETEIVTIWFCQ